MRDRDDRRRTGPEEHLIVPDRRPVTSRTSSTSEEPYLV
jgi:hypothetical protein